MMPERSATPDAESLCQVGGHDGRPIAVSKPSFEENLTRQKLILALLVGAVAISFAGVVRVFFAQEVLGAHLLVLVIIFIAFLGLPIFQMAMAYYLCFRFRLREIPPPEPGLAVDVFVTALDEPLWLVERTLTAALAMRYPHRTFLLDDGDDNRYEALTRRLGAEYRTRPGNAHFKAGNLNAALESTTGDFVAIFDVDHTPHPDFLDRSLGLFADPEVGFVQGMVTFSNHDESLVARASAETALDFYNITAVGKDRCGAASLIGSNAVIRREALEHTGLYKPGLAEDLETSLSLHAGGWRSAYVREPLAPGLSPTDLMSFWKQQLKWSSGVFEAALRSFKHTFFKLTLNQKLCYTVRFSYYLLGVIVFMNLAALTVALAWPVPGVEKLVLAMLPFTVASWISRIYPLRTWALEPLARKGILLRGSSLFVSSWPVYVISAVSAVLRVRIPFLSTPKETSRSIPLWAVLPQLTMVTVLGAAIVWRGFHWQSAPMPLTAAFAAFIIVSHWLLFVEMSRTIRRSKSNA